MNHRVLPASAELSSVLELGRKQGWTLLADKPRTHLRMRLVRWETPQGILRWVENHGIGIRFLQAEGEFPAGLPEGIPLRELQAQCESDDPCLVMAGLAGWWVAEPEDAFFAQLGRHAVHPNVWVRRHARNLCQLLSDPRARAAIEPAIRDPLLGTLWKREFDRLSG